MSIAIMNRIAELEKRVEVLEAGQRRDAVLGRDEWNDDELRRKPGRPRKHEAPQAQEGKA